MGMRGVAILRWADSQAGLIASGNLSKRYDEVCRTLSGESWEGYELGKTWHAAYAANGCTLPIMSILELSDKKSLEDMKAYWSAQTGVPINYVRREVTGIYQPVGAPVTWKKS
jgi:hypothetical protein